MPNSRFSEFSSSDKTSWKKQLAKELNGKLSSAENWKITDSLSFDSYYTREDLNPEEAINFQTSQRQSTGWLNTSSITFTSAWETNSKIKSSLAAGADSVLLDLKNTPLLHCELAKTLHGIRLSDTPVFFKTRLNPDQLFDEISRGAGYYLKGGIAFDPLADWMRSAQPFTQSLDNIVLILGKTKNMREFRPLMVESHIYHDAGANPVQEVALLMSALVTCMDNFTDAGILPVQALNRFFFSVSIGTNYLTEIAKLRAVRFLYRRICRAYQLPDELSHAFIHVKTSSFYEARSLPHTNMIRTTCEAMSGVIGGCDALTVQAFDHSFQQPDDFSSRISGNVSALLSNESYLNHVADPAAGSYMLENMSVKIAEAAWALFLEIEDRGGLVKCFEEGLIQTWIDHSWQQKTDSFRQGHVMVGVNKYQDPATAVSDNFISTADHPSQTSTFRTLPKRNLAAAGVIKSS